MSVTDKKIKWEPSFGFLSVWKIAFILPSWDFTLALRYFSLFVGLLSNPFQYFH